MTEPLVVDPARLKAAGIELRSQVFPNLPPAIAATGSDSISAAINETLPIIESPVIDGIPAAKIALTNTAANMVTAAEMYIETDQRLADHVTPVEFLASAAGPPGVAGAAGPATGPSAALTNQVSSAAGAVADSADVAPQLRQATTAAGTLGTMAQSVTQGVQSATSNLQGATAPTTPGNPGKSDDEEQRGDEGAAAGEGASQSAPVGAAAAGRRDTAARPR